MWYGLKQDGVLVSVEFFPPHYTPDIYSFALVPNGIMSNKKYEIVKVKITEIEV